MSVNRKVTTPEGKSLIAGILSTAHERAQAAAPTSAVQNAQRLAATGMLLRHSGQSRTVGSTGGSVFRRSIKALIGLTTRKNTAAAMSTKAIRAFRNAPYGNTVPGSPVPPP